MCKIDISRLSFNHMTAKKYDLYSLLDACSRLGIRYVGMWRHKIAEVGLEQAANLLQAYGIRASSLCRGGMFPARSEEEFADHVDDNKRAIEEAARIDAEVLVLVCGPAADKDLSKARYMVEKGIDVLLPYARSCGIRLGIEPMHPVFASDRSVIVTMEQANDLIDKFNDEYLGLVLDTFHIWWDPKIDEQIRRASGKILGFHVNDYPRVVDRSPLVAREMMGKGIIDIRRIRIAVESAGYTGPIEVEVFNDELWNMSLSELLSYTKESFLQYV